jgi:hypothetical protein
MIKEYQLQKLQNSYEVTLHYKGVKVRVAFVGGNVYNGTKPKLRTDNPFKMKALEASELFKNKEVVLLRVIGASLPTGKAAVPAKDRASRIKPMEAPAGKTAAQTSPKVEGTAAAAPEPVAEAPATEPATETAPKGDGMKTMEFQNPAEAILYIAQTWQIQVQTEAEARQTLKEHGINPKIKRG